jgi:hypothetical protein
VAGGVGVRHCPPYFSVLCLRICQAATVHVNVLMIQDILADPDRDGMLTVEDACGRYHDPYRHPGSAAAACVVIPVRNSSGYNLE